MRKSVYRSAVVAAVLGSAAVVATAAEINLTAQQKQSIMQGVQSELGQSSAGFQPRIGTPVPQVMSMRELPSNVTAQVPATKDLGYVKLDNNMVLLVDPKDRRVADIITPSGTTGAAPAPISPAPAAPRSPAAPR